MINGVRSNPASPTRQAGFGSAACGLTTIALLLTGCVFQRPVQLPPPQPPVAQITPPPEHAEPPPIPKKKPVSTPAPEIQRTPPQVASVEPPPPTAPPPPIEVLGLDPAGVRAILGEPAAQDDSPPAVMWRYSAGTCGLRIYFYQDFQSRELRALFLDVDGDDQSNQHKQSCLHSVRHGAALDPASTASAR
jgi:hypothetical protein